MSLLWKRTRIKTTEISFEKNRYCPLRPRQQDIRSEVRLTWALKVLLLALPPHERAPWTRGIHVPGQGAHVEGRETVGRHGARRERVAESCRERVRGSRFQNKTSPCFRETELMSHSGEGSIKILYLSKSNSTTLWKHSITSKSPAFTVTRVFKYNQETVLKVLKVKVLHAEKCPCDYYFVIIL